MAGLSLSDVNICADEETLRAFYPPPKTAEAKRKVAAIREKLAEVNAFEKTGRYLQGLELVQRLADDARSVAYQPVQAEVLYRHGRLLEKSGEYKDAETKLYEAARLAGKSKDDLLAAKAIIRLVFVVGYLQARPKEGLSLGRAAEAMLEVAGGDVRIKAKLLSSLGGVLLADKSHEKALEFYRKALKIQEETLGLDHPEVARLLNAIGVVFKAQGKYTNALEIYHKSLTIYDKSLGPEHPTVANTLNNLGVIYWKEGIYDKALDYYRQALVIKKKALGPQHPNLANTLNNLGLLFWKRTEYNKALAYFRDAKSIWEKVPDHPGIAWSLSGIGAVLVDKGRHQEATMPLERVVSICKKRTCQLEPYAHGLFGLAQALVATGGDKKRAIKLAKQAREIFGKTTEVLEKELKEVNNWLKELGQERLAKKVHE